MQTNFIVIMALRYRLKGFAIYIIVFIIGLLLVSNIFLIYKNNQKIEHNKTVYENAEKIKVNTVEIIRNLHLVDMALRSFALVKQEKFLALADTSLRDKDTTFHMLERSLAAQNYPMAHFYSMRDSVMSYYRIIDQMKAGLIQGRFNEFNKLLESDPGMTAWNSFMPFSKHVNDFEDRISTNAQAEYKSALRNSYLLQILLFCIAMPTLVFTAYDTTKVLTLSEELRISNETNYSILAEQNAKLESMVKERTSELLIKNEEISAQNEQLVLHQREIEVQRNELRERNEKLQLANRTIEEQHQEIQQRNDELALEIDRQTQHLKKTNLELIEHNSRLEQFAYIISHNLRAPMARLIGLSSILQHATDADESSCIIQMMIKAAGDLDQVIRDLDFIVNEQKPGSQLLKEVKLHDAVNKALAILETECQETGAVLERNFENIESIKTLPQYIESIFFNLISNAIKYRHPERKPVISITATQEEEFVRIEVADNGLGIDMSQNRDLLFNLYKRFHFHVEGKGLGLYLVKTQISALGGKIEVQSKPDLGTTFILFLKK